MARDQSLGLILTAVRAQACAGNLATRAKAGPLQMHEAKPDHPDQTNFQPIWPV